MDFKTKTDKPLLITVEYNIKYFGGPFSQELAIFSMEKSQNERCNLLTLYSLHDLAMAEFEAWKQIDIFTIQYERLALKRVNWGERHLVFDFAWGYSQYKEK